MEKATTSSTLTHYAASKARRAVKRSDDVKSVSFGCGATAIIAALILFASFDLSTYTFTIGLVIVSAIFFVEAAVLLLVRKILKSELSKKYELSRKTRFWAVPLILFICTGNIFSFVAGMTLIKKNKNLEYQIGVYMFLIDLVVILVSFINIFKGYIMSTFIMAIAALVVIAVVHLVITLLLASWVKGNCAEKRVLPLIIILTASAFTGNVLALLLAGIVFKKYLNKDPDIASNWIDIIKRLFRSNTAALGILIVIVLLMLSIWANWTFDYSVAVENNYSAILQGPSLKYPLGTDDFGRCVFTRIIFGAKISLISSVCTVTITAVVGVTLGAIAGYYSGIAEVIIMRVMDVLLATPGLLLPIAVVSSLGKTLPCIIVAIAITPIPAYARTIRASILTIKGAEFVQAAKACGAKNSSIIMKHLLPNSMAPLIVRMTMSLGANVLALSSLSYLGVGVDSHIPEWGSILKTGSEYLEAASWLAIFPGIMIILLVLSFNFLGDGMRDAMDPKLK